MTAHSLLENCENTSGIKEKMHNYLLKHGSGHLGTDYYRKQGHVITPSVLDRL